MLGRWKSKQPRSTRYSSGLKENMISQLPDTLLCEIISYLTAKEAVRTSVLSTRWRSLWLWVPRLELDFKEFPDFNEFVSFGNRFFDSSRASCIDKVKLTIEANDDDVDDRSYITSWFDAMVRRNIKHLDAKCPPKPEFHKMPLAFFICKTLVYLKLNIVSFENANLSKPEFVSLPCLKTMHLANIMYPNEATFERLVSSCPVLEELKMVGSVSSNAKFFTVRSRSLKKLIIQLEFVDLGYGSGVMIDAPQLSYLSINDNFSQFFIIRKMHSRAKINIRRLTFDLLIFDEEHVLPKRSRICCFLRGISEVKEMIISPDTFKIICQYSKLEPVRQFRYMCHLQVNLNVLDLKLLPTFIENFPKLESLILEWVGYSKHIYSEEMNQISFSSVPQRLLSSLRFVQINNKISGYAAEMKLVEYFLDSSVVLKKLTLSLAKHLRKENLTLKKLLRMPRGSTKCEVVILD